MTFLSLTPAFFTPCTQGTVVITQSRSVHGTFTGQPIEVGRLRKGDYFGEMALLKNQPRAANVVALGAVKCLALSEKDFSYLMGPCEDILKRNMSLYKTLEQTIMQSQQEGYGVLNPNPEIPRTLPQSPKLISNSPSMSAGTSDATTTTTTTTTTTSTSPISETDTKSKDVAE
jgi:hypothetical protein